MHLCYTFPCALEVDTAEYISILYYAIFSGIYVCAIITYYFFMFTLPQAHYPAFVFYSIVSSL